MRDGRDRFKDYRPPMDGFRRMDYPMDRRGPEPYGYRGSSPGRGYGGGREYGGRGRTPPPYDREYRGPPPMEYHGRSPVRTSGSDPIAPPYRPRTPERFQNDYHDRMRERGPTDHMRGKSPERDRGYPGTYPPRAHSPSGFNRRGYENYPPRDDRFRTGPPPVRGDPSSRDPRMDRDPRDRTDSRLDGNRESRTDERTENFTGGQSIEKRMHTP